MSVGLFIGSALAGQALILLGVGLWITYGPGQGMVYFGGCLFFAALALGYWFEAMDDRIQKRKTMHKLAGPETGPQEAK